MQIIMGLSSSDFSLCFTSKRMINIWRLHPKKFKKLEKKIKIKMKTQTIPPLPPIPSIHHIPRTQQRRIMFKHRKWQPIRHKISIFHPPNTGWNNKTTSCYPLTQLLPSKLMIYHLDSHHHLWSTQRTTQPSL